MAGARLEEVTIKREISVMLLLSRNKSPTSLN